MISTQTHLLVDVVVPRRTLSIHEVANRNRMIIGDLEVHGPEHSIRMALGTGPEVLLTQVLDLSADGEVLLLSQTIRNFKPYTVTKADRYRCTYELLGQGDLLELHLVHCGLGGAEQHSCRQQSALHPAGDCLIKSDGE